MKVISATVFAIIIVSCVWAQGVVTWNGDTDANVGGNWSVAANWDTDAVPVLTNVVLPSVTQGLRTVTQDVSSGVAIASLLLQQSGTSGTNKLSLNGDITFSQASVNFTSESSTASAFQVDRSEGASVEHVIVDLNGHAMIVTNSPGGSKAGGNVSGTVLFSAPDSAIYSTYAGHTYYNVFGDIEVTADGFMGRHYTGTGSSTGQGVIMMMAGSSLTVQQAVFSIEVGTRYNSSDPTRCSTLENYGNILVDTNGTLSVGYRISSSISSAVGNALFKNNAGGAMVQRACLLLRPFRGATATYNPYARVQNAGIWRIEGTGATLVRGDSNLNTSYLYLPEFTNLVEGVLCGSGANDVLEFDEESADGSRRMTLANSGTIMPGAGSQGAELASIGVLRLRDMDVTMLADGHVELDLGGPEAGSYDQVSLETGASDPAGAGFFDASKGGTLQLFAVNGFGPVSKISLPLIVAGEVRGQFASVKLGASEFTENRLDLGREGTYEVVYSENAVQLVFTPRPTGSVVYVF